MPPAGATALALPDTAARVLAGHDIPESAVSVLVQALDEPQPRIAVNVDEPRNPASTLKLLTTFAALDALNPAYRWKTEAYALGPVGDDGVLDGDLLLKGYGDPYLVTEEFWKLLRGIRRAGVREIRGDLVIDDTYFELPPEDPSAFDGQPHRVYNVPPNALLVNFRAVTFEFAPAAGGRRVRVVTEPTPANLEVESRVALRRAACGGYQRGVSFAVPDEAGWAEVVLEGRYPSGCGRYAFTRTVLQPDTYVYGLFRTLWSELGGTLAGTLRRAPAPPGAEPLITHWSPPLGDVIRLVNKYSNNVMTRHLLLTLGAESGGSPATPEKSKTALLEWMHSRGLDTTGLVVDNGAGLSRDARITARQLRDLLMLARRSPFMPEFVSSLSLAGLDGTVGRRFRDQAMAGSMHLKTGRLDDVAAIAGYVKSRSGQDFALVVVVNAEDAHRGPGEELQNELLRWTWRQ